MHHKTKSISEEGFVIYWSECHHLLVPLEIKSAQDSLPSSFNRISLAYKMEIKYASTLKWIHYQRSNIFNLLFAYFYLFLQKIIVFIKAFGFWDCHFFKSFTNFMSKQWFILQLQYIQNFREFLASDSKARVSRLSNSDSILTLVKVVSDS